MIGQFRAPLICPQCNVSTYYCPCSRARLEAIHKSTREAIRIASKPRARLIKAFTMPDGGAGLYPSCDTWIVHKEFYGRIVRGYGYTMEGAWLDYKQMLSIANRAFLTDPERWK